MYLVGSILLEKTNLFVELRVVGSKPIRFVLRPGNLLSLGRRKLQIKQCLSYKEARIKTIEESLIIVTLNLKMKIKLQ